MVASCEMEFQPSLRDLVSSAWNPVLKHRATVVYPSGTTTRRCWVEITVTVIQPSRLANHGSARRAAPLCQIETHGALVPSLTPGGFCGSGKTGVRASALSDGFWTPNWSMGKFWKPSFKAGEPCLTR